MSVNSGRSLHLSDTLSISCGTVTLDLVRARLLLIRWKKNQDVLLPKGRKNIGEKLEDAALRETYEETGFRVTATPATASDPFDQSSAVTEPVAVSQRLIDNKLKLIFWFAAKGDSTAAPSTGTQQEGEETEPVWADLNDAVQSLTFDDDRQIAQAVINIVSTSSHFNTG
jgi:8-oxo-dGTP pyrophosphatase MutT (NUDIX family)